MLDHLPKTIYDHSPSINRKPGFLSFFTIHYGQWPFQDPRLEVPTIYKAYVREYPHNIWPYMVQYLHFRILKISHWLWGVPVILHNFSSFRHHRPFVFTPGVHGESAGFTPRQPGTIRSPRRIASWPNASWPRSRRTSGPFFFTDHVFIIDNSYRNI